MYVVLGSLLLVIGSFLAYEGALYLLPPSPISERATVSTHTCGDSTAIQLVAVNTTSNRLVGDRQHMEFVYNSKSFKLVLLPKRLVQGRISAPIPTHSLGYFGVTPEVLNSDDSELIFVTVGKNAGELASHPLVRCLSQCLDAFAKDVQLFPNPWALKTPESNDLLIKHVNTFNKQLVVAGADEEDFAPQRFVADRFAFKVTIEGLVYVIHPVNRIESLIGAIKTSSNGEYEFVKDGALDEKMLSDFLSAKRKSGETVADYYKIRTN